MVQALLSLHTTLAPPQVPVVHASLLVQALPSSQVVPLATAEYTHAPLATLQLSEVQALLSLHTLAVPAQVPLLHASLAVQALPSLQAVPLAALAKAQTPVAVVQVSVVQALLSLQTLAVPPHLPAVQASLLVQALPSSQLPPSATAVYTHAPLVALQLSVVQALLSLQTLAVPPQTPVLQASALVHALPSLQVAPSVKLVWLHTPLVALHVSVVHG